MASINKVILIGNLGKDPEVRYMSARTLHLVQSMRALLPAVPVALALMALFWPWSMQAPGNLFTALTTFSHFTFPLYTVLDGEVMKIGDVPRSYLPVYLVARMPELTLAGLVLALPAAGQGLRRDARRGLVWMPVVLAASLPLALALATRPSLYNGIRHFTFLLPPLAILAAAGLHATWQALRGRQVLARVLVALCAAAAALPLYDMAQLAPYHYMNYNRFAGGFEGAPARWETDYWSDAAREAASLLRTYLRDEPVPDEPWQVAVCAESIQAGAWLPSDRFVITRDWVRADFFIATTHMRCDEVLLGKVIGEVNRIGVPLSIVKDRRALPPDKRRPLR